MVKLCTFPAFKNQGKNIVNQLNNNPQPLDQLKEQM